MTTGRWTVEIYITERNDAETSAQAVLVTGDRTAIRGVGAAHRSPEDPPVHEIGDELAVARALIDLGHRVEGLAAADVRDNTRSAQAEPSGGWELP